MGRRMLSVEIKHDGGIRIAGTAHDLRSLATWLERAAEVGHAEPAFASDEALTTIEIRREHE
jgi:hypothetical protein